MKLKYIEYIKDIKCHLVNVEYEDFDEFGKNTKWFNVYPNSYMEAGGWINGYEFDLTSEVFDWLKENISRYWFHNGEWYFPSKEEAILFKLTWG